MNEAILLAGGLGTRLRTVVSDVPKPMAPVAGKPFLEYLMQYWTEQGIERFVLSVGHLHGKISSHFGKGWHGTEVVYSVEHEPLGTGGAIAQALELVKGRAAFVGNGDTFVELDLRRMAGFHSEKGSVLTVASAEVDSAVRYSTLQVSQDGRLEGFLPGGNATSGRINAGVYCVEKSLLNAISVPGEKFSWEIDYLPKVLKHSGKAYVFAAGSRFLDIGVPEDYARAAEFLL